jgi:hypothetical protein
MPDEELLKVSAIWRRPIPWDPVPIWLKLTEEQMRKFAAMEVRLNTKINEIQEKALQDIARIEAQKLQEFGKIVGA